MVAYTLRGRLASAVNPLGSTTRPVICAPIVAFTTIPVRPGVYSAPSGCCCATPPLAVT